MTVAAAERVRYEVDGAVLVDDVDFMVTAGELVAVIGPNGAGKTTLVRLLAGDLEPGDGGVTIDGRPVAGYPPEALARRRAVLSQQLLRDVPFTCRAVVAMGRFPHRLDPANSAARDAAEVAAALARTDMAEFADRTFATLSGGEQTLVALARVLAQDAPLLLLDEPTTALDVHHEELVMRVVKELAAAGRAVVAVLHDLNTAAAYADRMVLMADGRVRADGSPAEVLDEALLSEVYGQAVRVVDHPFRDCPLVLVVD